jgi:hypothetical protein
MRLLAGLGDGHTELNIGQQSVGFHRMPLSLYFFEQKLYITAAHDAHADLVGGVITHINHVPTDKAFKALQGSMSRDNEMEYLHAGPGYLIITELLHCLGITSGPSEAGLTIVINDEKIIERKFQGLAVNDYSNGPWVDFRSLNNLETPLYLTQPNARYWHQYLPEHKTMYFNFSRVNNQKGKPSIKKFVSALFKEIDEKKPEKLIIDFRLNNGGNYNLSRPLIEAIKSRDWLNQKGSVWAISGRRTFSAASIACLFLLQETNTTLVGEPGRTHPNQADNNEYMNLPNSGFLIEYTTKIKKHWPDQPDADRVPVDIVLPPTFEGYSKGIDGVLEYILKQ